MSEPPFRHILTGFTVLDFTQVLSGPTATRLMVEMGAEVIKIEMARLHNRVCVRTVTIGVPSGDTP